MFYPTSNSRRWFDRWLCFPAYSAVQPSVALESYLEEVKVQLAEIQITKT